MGLPTSLNPVFEKLPPEAQISVKRDFDNRSKSMLVAYLAWFFLGWHYLYLKRVGLQIAFWLTLGGFGLWWLVDLFRVAGIVNRMNEDAARELMVQYKALSA
ncbi:MAG TPA: TM2 domain-containing protein [Nitrospira sp.]|nr:TM2 domain-containing protein [Nitrospira sp.]